MLAKEFYRLGLVYVSMIVAMQENCKLTCADTKTFGDLQAYPWLSSEFTQKKNRDSIMHF